MSLKEQDTVFWESEGNAYWWRNRSALLADTALANDWPMTLLDLYHIRPTQVVDVGCAAGTRLEALRQRYGCACHGVDASKAAIDEGCDLYPQLHLVWDVATQIHVATSWADLAVAHYVYHWLARQNLFEVTDEIDRVLRVGGHVILGDFAPNHPTRAPYKHKDGLYTWKMPDAYAGFFTASGCYREIARVTYDHDTHEVRSDVPSERRGAVVLLRKESQYRCVSV